MITEWQELRNEFKNGTYKDSKVCLMMLAESSSWACSDEFFCEVACPLLDEVSDVRILGMRPTPQKR